uniref:B box-type domain-containing protein n=1 Tax=Monodon monoceros TaxID=40151 RepID=A0A8C6CBH7_MONMO
MALASSLAQLQAEASCPICLDYLRDACWEGLHDIFPCRVCLQPCPDKGIRRNSQLCLMIDFVRQLPSTEEKRKWQKEKPLCEKHRHVLSLFCEKDLELLCLQCRVSSDHRDHPLAPMEQAAACHRRRLKVHIEPLKKQLEDAEKSLEMQASKSFELVRKVNNQRRELQCVCSIFSLCSGIILVINKKKQTKSYFLGEAGHNLHPPRSNSSKEVTDCS